MSQPTLAIHHAPLLLLKDMIMNCIIKYGTRQAAPIITNDDKHLENFLVRIARKMHAFLYSDYADHMNTGIGILLRPREFPLLGAEHGNL